MEMYNTPIVIEKTGNGETSYDLYSRLLKDRIIFLGTDINSFVRNSVTAQLLFLESQEPDKPIFMYINSPGGSVHAGLGIYDTMQYIRPEIHTICTGIAMSMGCFLLAAGTKGKRYALPHSQVMMHPVSGGVQGSSPDVTIGYEEHMFVQAQMNSIFSKHCDQTVESIDKAFQRDKYMSPEEAVAFGIIDSIQSKSMRVTNE